MRIQAVQDIIDFVRYKIFRYKARKDSEMEFYKKYTPPTSTYKNLIVTQGFGHSGSGVIIDLLAEFDNTTVIGGHDINGGSPLSKCKNAANGEIDFIRVWGGVFSLESICRDIPNFYKKHHILNFINLVEFYFQGDTQMYNDKFLALSYDFVDKLVKTKIKIEDSIAEDVAFKYEKAARCDYKNLMSPYRLHVRNNRYCYYVRDLTIKEFRTLAKKFLLDFFNSIQSKENLVLDYALCDYEADFDKYQDYVGDYRYITVYRDPRDVYMTGILLNESWIPKDVEDFCVWYNDENKNLDKYINSRDSRQLVLKFEDLVLNYDESLSKILNFGSIKLNGIFSYQF